MSRQGLLQINKDDIPANNVECINRKIKEYEAEIAALKKKLKTCRDTAVLDEEEVGVKIGNVLFLDLCELLDKCGIDIDSEFDIANNEFPYFHMDASGSISMISDDSTIDKAIKHIESWYTQYGKIYKFLKEQKAAGVRYILAKPDDAEELDEFEFD